MGTRVRALDDVGPVVARCRALSELARARALRADGSAGALTTKAVRLSANFTQRDQHGGHATSDRSRFSHASFVVHASRSTNGTMQPVLHRHVRPSNVLIGWDGRVKLGDFSLPRPSTAGADINFEIGEGRDGYMPPEQVTGKELCSLS
jgi:serine/threonine protein kinase